MINTLTLGDRTKESIFPSSLEISNPKEAIYVA